MNREQKLSYAVFVAILIIIVKFKMATPLITVLFSSLALRFLKFRGKKWIAVVLFTLLVLTILYGFGHFSNQAVATFPKVIETSVPKMIDFAEEKGIWLPFSDLQSLKSLSLDQVKEQAGYLAGFLKLATTEFVLILIGLVIATSIFINSKIDSGESEHKVKNNLYSALTSHLIRRFQFFYESFETVMGAQIVISAINASLTGMFLLVVRLPYAPVIIVLAFLVGLLPIVGNLISNTVIFFVAMTVSPILAIASLVFLIVLHKLEYFLNSKIVGYRIKSPMWLTLIFLVIGERVMGIPGMILAPVLLHYIRAETSQIAVHL